MEDNLETVVSTKEMKPENKDEMSKEELNISKGMINE